MTPEHRIQNEIRVWCGQHDILCFRCNVGRVRCADGTWFDTGLPKGFPDLILLHRGTISFVEVKAAGGYQSPEQRQFERIITDRGYIYVVARSVGDVIAGLGYNNDGGN